MSKGARGISAQNIKLLLEQNGARAPSVTSFEGPRGPQMAPRARGSAVALSLWTWEVLPAIKFLRERCYRIWQDISYFEM